MHRFRPIFVLLFCTLLTGCSFRLSYNWLDWLISWQVNDYVRLDRTQQAQLDKAIEGLHSWHRKTELPRYSQHAVSLQAQMNTPLTSSLALAHLETISQYWQRVYARSLPHLIPLLISLDDKQTSELLSNLTEEYQESLNDYRQTSPTDRQTSSYKKRAKRFRKWVGQLNAEQELLLRQWGEISDKGFGHFLQQDKYLLDEFNRLLAKRKQHDFPQKLSHLLNTEVKGTTNNQFVVEYRAAYAAWLVEFTNSMSNSQKQAVISRLQSYIDDFNYLAAH